jgi:hypothetical protein
LSVIRPIVAFLLCLLVSLAVLDVGILFPDFVVGNTGDDWGQLIGILALVNAIAAPVVAFGGFLTGFFVLSGQRENGNSSQLDWMTKFGALAGATYGGLAFLIISESAGAVAIGCGAGAVAGALCGVIWCLLVERPRHA